MQDIRLYIGEMAVDFKQSPDILYNWTETDLTNPTVTKNGYSKTISIEGTPNNNKIFGHFWNLERHQEYGGDNGVYYNPTYRVPFVIYVNGDIFEKGYCKLQKVLRNSDNVITYEIGLFGGLGSFLYNLSTDWNTGEKKTLGSLTYYRYPIMDTGKEYEDDTEMDLGFTINKDTVNDAWNNIWTFGSKYKAINFAPCYNGLSDKLTTDKGVVNLNDIPAFLSATTVGGVTYRGSNGYCLANLPEDLNEWETKDLRSWTQRPIVSAKAVIDAIQRKKNNSGKYDNGYEVELDENFFNGNNPYINSWMTLPLLTDLEFNSKEGSIESYTANYSTAVSIDGSNNVEYVFNLSQPISQFGVSITAKFDLAIGASSSADYLYPSFWVGAQQSTQQVRNGYGLQLWASNSQSADASVLSSSHIKWLGYKRETGYWKVAMPSYSKCIKNKTYVPKEENTVDNDNGRFVKVSNNQYRWSHQIELTCDLPVGATCFKIGVQRVSENGSSWLRNKLSPVDGSVLYTALIEPTSTSFINRDIEIQYPDLSNYYSDSVVTQEQLLSTSYTPADWLMAYCKMFGLYIHKDVVEDKIYIDTRETYYRRNNIKDISELIDYSKDFEITPVACESGYYLMQNEVEDGDAYTNYMDKYGKNYGMKIINTGYEFDADSKDLISIPFKGAVQVLDNGKYYFKSVEGIQPYIDNGLSYILYQNGVYTGNTTTIEMTRREISDWFQPFDSDYTHFDLFDKPQFCDGEGKPVDGANVLLFFNGTVDVSDDNYIISDDLDAMSRLNNNPCYLITTETTDIGGNVIAIKRSTLPKFSRYYTPGNQKKIQFSMDFGSVRQLYVPKLINNDDVTLYSQFYKTYLEDLYDVNTRVVDCYLKTDKMLTEDDLRNFYWFNNRLWRLNKVTDYNPNSENTVKVQFIAVNDIQNMTNIQPDDRLKIYLSINPTHIPLTGGTAVLTLVTNDGMGGYVEPNYDDVTLSTSTLNSDGDIIVTVPAYSSERTIYFNVEAGDISSSISLEQGQYGTLTGISLVASWVRDIPATGGTATSANCNVTVYGDYDDGSSMDITSAATITGTYYVPATSAPSREWIGTMSLWADYGEFSVVEPVEVYQQGVGYYFNVSPSSRSVLSASTTTTFTVTSNGEWTIAEYPYWVTPSGTQFTGNSIVTFTISQNTGSARSGNVIFSPDWSLDTSAVTIHQEGGVISNDVTVNLVFGDVTAPNSYQGDVIWDDYTLYYDTESSSPVGIGDVAINYPCGALLYAGDTWNPMYATDYQVNSPFIDSYGLYNKVLLPASYRGQTLYFQAEFGCSDLQQAIQSQVVTVNIPSTGDVTITIPQF